MTTNQYKLFSPYAYRALSLNEKTNYCNGCGSKGGFFSFLVPNSAYGLSIKECCNIHDYMYAKGRTDADKKQADRVFLNNMVRVIEGASSNVVLKFLRLRRAKKMYLAVKYFGGPAFWADKNK